MYMCDEGNSRVTLVCVMQEAERLLLRAVWLDRSDAAALLDLGHLLARQARYLVYIYIVYWNSYAVFNDYLVAYLPSLTLILNRTLPHPNP
jgi:hypothetical protein